MFSYNFFGYDLHIEMSKVCFECVCLEETLHRYKAGFALRKIILVISYRFLCNKHLLYKVSFLDVGMKSSVFFNDPPSLKL